MSWKREVDGIEERRRRALELGGADAVARQHEKGRLTVRERIERFVDAGSFDEQGPIAGHAERDEAGRLLRFTGANYVLGLARVDAGRRDGIVRAGLAGATTAWAPHAFEELGAHDRRRGKSLTDQQASIELRQGLVDESAKLRIVGRPWMFATIAPHIGQSRKVRVAMRVVDVVTQHEVGYPVVQILLERRNRTLHLSTSQHPEQIDVSRRRGRRDLLERIGTPRAQPIAGARCRRASDCQRARDP